MSLTPSAPSQTPSQASGSQQSTSALVIPISAPAGGLTITQPPQTATSFYKIAKGNLITFGWNFTDVLATPTHLTVSAVCDNGNTYPVGPTDGIIPGTATQVVWDPFAYDQANPNIPLAPTTYTLNIWDERGPGAARAAGFMQPNSALKFALYTPQAYTPLASGWTCAGCSSALTAFATNPMFLGVMVSIIVIFLSGFNLLRHTGFR